MKQKFVDGDEWDSVYSKQYLHWRPGERRAVKKKMNRRFRQEGKREARYETDAHR